jgi:hypothetical protein
MEIRNAQPTLDLMWAEYHKAPVITQNQVRDAEKPQGVVSCGLRWGEYESGNAIGECFR